MVIDCMALTMVLAVAVPVFPAPADQVKYERCVAKRESEFTATAVNPTGSYRGMFQFSEPLKDGATWHMMPWLRSWHPEPKKLASALRATPMNEWPAQLQRAAFYSILNANGKWSGKRHWAGGRWHCA